MFRKVLLNYLEYLEYHSWEVIDVLHLITFNLFLSFIHTVCQNKYTVET